MQGLSRRCHGRREVLDLARCCLGTAPPSSSAGTRASPGAWWSPRTASCPARVASTGGESSGSSSRLEANPTGAERMRTARCPIKTRSQKCKPSILQETPRAASDASSCRAQVPQGPTISSLAATPASVQRPGTASRTRQLVQTIPRAFRAATGLFAGKPQAGRSQHREGERMAVLPVSYGPCLPRSGPAGCRG